MKILILHKDISVLMNLRDLLRAENHQVFVAHFLRAALKVGEKSDLLILDSAMQYNSVVERFPLKPTILLSTLARGQFPISELSSRMKVLYEPFHINELLDLIQELL